MTRQAPVQRDAATLGAARRVLVTGGGSLAAETAARACDLAEAVGAAVDFGGAETAWTTGPTLARIGAVTADPEELRDRADLVVFWFCDPSTVAADFLPRSVTPATAAGRPRHTVAVGHVEVATAAAADRRLQVAETDALDLARLVHAGVAGLAVRLPPALVAAREALVTALGSAGCVAFVTHHRDPLGLVPWGVAALVRALAQHRPAFEVPLEPAGAATAVCTWRYGAAGGVARADRDGAEFLPAESDAARLVARGEADCVVAVGRLPEALESALAARGDTVAVIRIPEDAAAARERLDGLLAALRAGSASGTVA